MHIMHCSPYPQQRSSPIPIFIKTPAIKTTHMKKLIVIITTTLFFISCKKDGTQLVLQPAGFSGSLKASSNSVVLASSNDNDSVVKFTWPAAAFSGQPAISYTLQLDR